MQLNVNLWPIIVTLITLISTVAVTFYLKDYLQKRTEYSKLKKKLEKIAGKNATIIYNSGGPPAMGGQLFKISEIDNDGITIQNELQTIFVPSVKLLKSEMILPCDDYEKAKLEKMKKDMEEMVEVMAPAMFEKLFPVMAQALKENFLGELMEEEGEVSSIIGFKIQKVLSEEGFEIKKIE